MERVDKALKWVGNNKRNLAAAGALIPSSIFFASCGGNDQKSESTQAASSVQTFTPEPTATAIKAQTPDTKLMAASPDRLGIGDAAPDFQLQTLDGKTIRLSDFKGRPVVIVTWAQFASNISDTAVSMVMDASRQMGDKVVVLVAADAPSKGLRQISGATVLLDSSGVVGQKFLSAAVPETLEIDKEGKFVARRSDLKTDLAADFAALVSGQAPKTATVVSTVSVQPGANEAECPVDGIDYKKVSRTMGADVLQRLNNVRTQAGLPLLEIDPTLQRLAEQKACGQYGKVDTSHLNIGDATAAKEAKDAGFAGMVKGFSVTRVAVGMFPTAVDMLDSIGKSQFADSTRSKDFIKVGLACTNGWGYSNNSQGAMVCVIEQGTK